MRRQRNSEAHPRAGALAVLTVRAAGASVTGALIGALIGTGTALVQPHVGQPWSALVNSSSPWLLGGFIAGALHRRRNPALLSGLATLVVEVGAYFATADLGRIPVLHAYTLFWTVCALVGGPVAGWAGWAWRWGGPRPHAFGAAFLPGSFIAEAFGAYGLRLHYEPALTMFLVIGAVLFALLAWPGTRLGLVASPGSGRVVLVWTAAFAVTGILVYGPLLNAVVGIYSGGVYYPP
ncbi:MAG TPA: DUF6518 family protein [Trebonia sp.]